MRTWGARQSDLSLCRSQWTPRTANGHFELGCTYGFRAQHFSELKVGGSKRVATIVQLSDLHLGISATQQASLVEPMYSSLSRLKSQGITVDLLVITGDLFESTDVTAEQAIETIGTLTSRIRESLTPTLPIILQPGNHDRRKSGIIGPHDPRIFDALKSGLDKRTLVTGCETPFLSELVSPEFHGLPWIIASFDSTFLPKGKFSAGGILRQEDLLQLAERLMDLDPKFPLVLLIHHHLIPTPLTDLSRVDVNTTGATGAEMVMMVVGVGTLTGSDFIL